MHHSQTCVCVFNKAHKIFFSLLRHSHDPCEKPLEEEFSILKMWPWQKTYRKKFSNLIESSHWWGTNTESIKVKPWKILISARSKIYFALHRCLQKKNPPQISLIIIIWNKTKTILMIMSKVDGILKMWEGHLVLDVELCKTFLWVKLLMQR